MAGFLQGIMDGQQKPAAAISPRRRGLVSLKFALRLRQLLDLHE